MTRPLKLLVIGSVNLDLIFKVPALPRRGENVLATGCYQASGGKGANQAVAAARLGAEVALAGKVGSDAYGEDLRTRLAEEQLHLEHLAAAAAPTGTAFITIDDRGDNTIVVNAGANAALTPEDIEGLRDEISRADLLLLQLEIPGEAVRRALVLARELGVRALVDAGPAQPFPLSDLAEAWLVSPNETEAGALLGRPFSGLAAAHEAARDLVRQGLPRVLLKLGSEGSLLARKGEGGAVELKHFPAYPVEAVDATAAGDAFMAALAVRLSAGASLDEAIPYANAAGALTATRLGAQPSLPTAAELASFLEERGARVP